MKRMRYCGKDRRLRGATALVRDDPVTAAGGNQPMVMAQFDCPALLIDGKRLGFGWTLTDRSDWREIPDEASGVDGQAGNPTDGEAEELTIL